MMTVTLPDQIERRVAKIARDQDVTPDELIQKAIWAYVQAESAQILDQETAAFRAMHAELLAKYLGEYVAVSRSIGRS